MNDIVCKYDVQFRNYYEEYDPHLEINFSANAPKDVIGIIEALSSHYSGDPCECYINGEKVVLEKDWGLLLPCNPKT